MLDIINDTHHFIVHVHFQTASTIASSQKANAKSKKDATKYAAWAAQQISLKYKVSVACN